MAKLRGPLFSFSASGAIGKALVYFGWKGLDVARSYVIPTNPRSTKQLAQRNLFTAAVAEFHAAAYDEDDMTAWALLASTLATPHTGFNAMVRSHIYQALGEGTWVRMHDVTVSPGDPGVSTVTVLSPEAVANDIFVAYGYSKHSQPNVLQADTADGTTSTFEIPALTEGKEVYLFIRGKRVTYKGKDYYEGRTGVYHYTALAAE